mmetsp:Transcript_100622/g.324730  ORF Transcript_100622/g.324730 Transcript_100622/m.324730 type:complete len:425 (-) Transcript_100622:68-1342(-)
MPIVLESRFAPLLSVFVEFRSEAPSLARSSSFAGFVPYHLSTLKVGNFTTEKAQTCHKADLFSQKKVESLPIAWPDTDDEDEIQVARGVPCGMMAGQPVAASCPGSSETSPSRTTASSASPVCEAAPPPRVRTLCLFDHLATGAATGAAAAAAAPAPAPAPPSAACRPDGAQQPMPPLLPPTPTTMKGIVAESIHKGPEQAPTSWQSKRAQRAVAGASAGQTSRQAAGSLAFGRGSAQQQRHGGGGLSSELVKEGWPVPVGLCAEGAPAKRRDAILSPSEPCSPGSVACDWPAHRSRGALPVRPANVTTVMIRNLPNYFVTQTLVEALCRSGFAGQFDFCYVPCNFANCEGKGFGFVNFMSCSSADRLIQMWHGLHSLGGAALLGPLNISAAEVQGRAANVQEWAGPHKRRIRNPVMRPFVADV